MRKRRAALVMTFSAAFAGAGAAIVLAAGGAYASLPPLSGTQSRPVASGAYTIENNEWGSGAPEEITTDGNADFMVANSSISQSHGAPGGYPSIYAGCHWGNCTAGGLAAHPVRVSTLTRPGTVTTSWKTTQPGGRARYNVAYDTWFNQAPTTSGQPNGTELMVWLNHHGRIQPFGRHVGAATIDGVSYRVWEGAQPWGDTVTYVRVSPTTSVRNLDVGALAADAVHRGYIRRSWYLIDVEAGFEIWNGGAGLATDAFSVNLHSGTGKPHTSTGKPGPAPSPASACSISRQAISPNPAAPGTAMNATVGFKDTGSTTASNTTLVTEVLNSAGTVVGSHSWTGQNIAPQQELSETYTWAVASPAGRYSIKGLVRDSSGRVLQQARVGTVTVT
jgi:cellulose 1,4-beta-cellobiosidase